MAMMIIFVKAAKILIIMLGCNCYDDRHRDDICYRDDDNSDHDIVMF